MNNDQRSLKEIFEYGFVSKHIGSIVTIVITVALVGFSIYGLLYGKGRMIGLVILWLALSPIILTGIWAERRYSTLFQPIEISVEGIATDLRGSGNENFPKRNPGFIKWSEIESVERFKWPDPDSYKAPPMHGYSGIRVFAGSKKMLVFRHIQRYAELYQIIEAQLHGYGKALQTRP